MNGIVERIIFLTQRPLSLRDYKRFGIELLRNNGFSVEIWDISHILYPKIFNNSKTLNNAGLVVFEKKKEACLRLSKLQHRDLVVTALSYNFESLWAYRALSSGRARYALRYVNILPVSEMLSASDSREPHPQKRSIFALDSVTTPSFDRISDGLRPFPRPPRRSSMNLTTSTGASPFLKILARASRTSSSWS